MDRTNTHSLIADALKLAAIEQAQWAKRSRIAGLVADGTIEALKARRVEIAAEFAAIDKKAKAENREMSAEETTSWNALTEEFKANEDAIKEADPEAAAAAETAAIEAQAEARKAHILAVLNASEEGGEQGGGERSQGGAQAGPSFISTGTESGDGPAAFSTRRSGTPEGQDVYEAVTRGRGVAAMSDGQVRDLAMRAVEGSTFRSHLVSQEDAQGRVGAFMGHNMDGALSALGREAAERTLLTGSEVYRSAFAKKVTGRDHAVTREEGFALERALQISGTGNFPVPVTLDPTLIMATSGAINPIRQLATVTPISGNTWNGITATTPAATRGANSTPVTPVDPTIAKPSITVSKASIEIEYEYEVDQDWPAAEAELARLISRAKDLEEATSFAVGTGGASSVTDTPQGFVTGATAVAVASTPAFTLADLYTLLESVAPEWQAVGRFAGALKYYDLIRQFDTAGGAGLWKYLDQGAGVDGSGQAGRLLGLPAHVVSTMSTATSASSKVLAFGDFTQYRIIDTLGMEIQPIPFKVDTSTGGVTGKKSLYAWWRNSGKLIIPAAIKVIQR